MIDPLHVIYGLIDPNTKELRYIGYTSKLRARYRHHYSISELRFNTHKNNWLKKLLSLGQKAELIVLEEHQTAEELPQAEIELIEYYKYIGCNLTNGTIGGDGASFGHSVSKETRRKMSESAKKSFTTERRAAVSQRNKGNKIWLGKKHSEQTKKKIAEKAKGNTRPLGIKRSEETKIKMSKAQKGRKHSEETKKKMSEQRKGRIPWNKGKRKDHVGS